MLVDLLSEIAPSEAQRRALLVENPRRFYRFPRTLETVTPASAGR